MILEKSKNDQAWLKGHASFKDLCEQCFKFTYRTARYLIDVYTHLVDQEIPWGAVKNLG